MYDGLIKLLLPKSENISYNVMLKQIITCCNNMPPQDDSR